MSMMILILSFSSSAKVFLLAALILLLLSIIQRDVVDGFVVHKHNQLFQRHIRQQPSNNAAPLFGVLTQGKPLPYELSIEQNKYIRKAGIQQFLNIYKKVKDLKGDELMYGDEVEFGIFDVSNKKLGISLRSKEIMDELNALEKQYGYLNDGCNWVPEYGAWMIEATPNKPYTSSTQDLLKIERNMRLRRARLNSVLKDNEVTATVSNYWLLGVVDNSTNQKAVGGPITESDYISDDVINPHPRFGTLTRNIRQRRGSKVSIKVPLFQDTSTPEYTNTLQNNSCCGGESQPLWAYGQADCYPNTRSNKELLTVGCTAQPGQKLKKYVVDTSQVPDCEGLFYRSKPGVICADASYPRNGDVVFGFKIDKDWIKLDNGYYLPIKSVDDSVTFLYEVTAKQSGTPTGSATSQLDNLQELFNGTNNGSVAQQLLVKNDINEDQDNDNNTNEGLNAQTIVPAIHMDAMAFGMGCTCLQVTFQAEDIDESRFLFDQLAVLAPIMMALTASSPIFRGRLADIDCRWGVISESVDDRTPAERGLVDAHVENEDLLAGKGSRRLKKSRYDCISSYIYQGSCASNTSLVSNNYIDLPVPVEEEYLEFLKENGIDGTLAQHIAHLFVRDPLVVFEDCRQVNDETQTDHFESIQSTNWQSVRWKPPPPRLNPNDPHIGWRTEFRSMETQLTDFENAAFTVFIVLLTRVMLSFDLNFYIPLSRVDTNMQRAHSRKAARNGKFFFRRHLAPLEEGDDGYGIEYKSVFSKVANGDEASVAENTSSQQRRQSSYRSSTPCGDGGSEENAYEEMTMEEIMTGKGDYFPGLIPLIFAYLDHIQCDSRTMENVSEYLTFIEKRAKGELITPATWIRNYVRCHPGYKFDSVITDEIAHDLMIACKEIGEGKLEVPELHGDIKIKPMDVDGAWDRKLESRPVPNQQLMSLLRRYTQRSSFKQQGPEYMV